MRRSHTFCSLTYIMLLTMMSFASAGSRSSSYTSCSNCGSSGYGSGNQLGQALRNVLGEKAQHIKGFFDGLSTSSGCGGCTSSCGSPGCGSSYVSGPSSCNNCYSDCGSNGCSSSHSSVPSHSSSNTVIAVQQSHSNPQTSSYTQTSSNSYNPSAYPNCQCDYLYNSAGQGNCNIDARSHTSDRWCYVANKVGHEHIEPQWACPDSVTSDVHHGRYWSRVACDTPHQHH